VETRAAETYKDKVGCYPTALVLLHCFWLVV